MKDEFPFSVSTAEFARIIGVSSRRVDQLVEKGTLHKNNFRELDLRTNLPAYLDSLRDAARHRGVKTEGGEVTLDPLVSKVKLDREKTLLQREKNRQRAADYVQAALLRRVCRNLITATRSRVDTLSRIYATALRSGGHTKGEVRAVEDYFERIVPEMELGFERAIQLMTKSKEEGEHE